MKIIIFKKKKKKTLIVELKIWIKTEWYRIREKIEYK